MDDRSKRSETTGLLDYVSYRNDYLSNTQRDPSREESPNNVGPVGLTSHSNHNVIVLVILIFTFLFTVLYLAVPIGVHICLQTECYFPQPASKGGRNDSSSDTNITRDVMKGAVGHQLKAPLSAGDGGPQGSCDIPATTIPFVPLLPVNYSIESLGFCYGQNNSDISDVTSCTNVLSQTKELLGYHNVSSSHLSKTLLGLSGGVILFYLDFALGFLFNYVSKEWPQCLPHAELAICQYLFPPLIDNKNLILALNRSDCMETRDNYCKAAWVEAEKQISSFVASCNKTYPILNMLHMPRCKQMPERSLIEAPNCLFPDVQVNLRGKTCHDSWQYPSVSLGLQDVSFIVTCLIAIALTFASCILPFRISRLTSSVFPYFSLLVMSGLFLVYALFMIMVYLTFISHDAQSGLFCPDAKEDNLAVIATEKSSTGFCKASAYLFHIIALSVAGMWLYNLIIAAMRLTDRRESPPFTVLRSIFSALLALALGGLAVLPSFISALDGTTMVFPRRPTVICVEEDEGREFFSFILPLAVLLLVGTAFIIYILYKTLVDLSNVRKKASLDRSFGSLQFYTLKPQLQVLLFHLIVSILLALMLALAVSSRLSALVFQLFILPIEKSSKLEKIEYIPIVALLAGVFIGVLPFLSLVIILVVEWAITASKIK